MVWVIVGKKRINIDYIIVGWFLFFLIVFPALTYIAARMNKVSPRAMIKPKFYMLAIPFALLLLTLIVGIVITGVSGLIETLTSLEPYQALRNAFAAEQVYKLLVLGVIVCQLIWTIVGARLFSDRNLFAFSVAFGLCGILLSVLFGVTLLNVI